MTLSPTENTVGFGLFELDLRTRQLTKNGAKIRLPQQPIRTAKRWCIQLLRRTERRSCGWRRWTEAHPRRKWAFPVHGRHISARAGRSCSSTRKETRTIWRRSIRTGRTVRWCFRSLFWSSRAFRRVGGGLWPRFPGHRKKICPRSWQFHSMAEFQGAFAHTTAYPDGRRTGSSFSFRWKRSQDRPGAKSGDSRRPGGKPARSSRGRNCSIGRTEHNSGS